MKMLRGFLAIILLCLLFLPAANAQEVRAAITGIVTDPSGAPVTGANIMVTNVDQNVTVTTRTNATGNYMTPYLTPGTYRLTIEHPGFKKYVRENIGLQTQSRARVDVTLELGELAQSVTVSEAVSQLETETASRSQTISNELIRNVPTQGRNPFQIAWATAGVVKTGSWRYLRSFDIGGTSGMSINGGVNKENEVLLDGLSDVQSSRTVIGVPTMESVQEFKVLTNTYDAQYGRTGGGIITIVTKSGTNDLHGTAFEYFQNDKLNANQWELNRGGVEKPPMRINAFGIQAAGPVYIPKVVDGRNRLFWLLSYEGMRQRSADPDTKTFPLMEWRGGDFSTLLNSQGLPVTIYDPRSTAADGTRLPFNGNRIPTTQISRIATEALKYYPAPTSAGIGPSHFDNYPFPSRWIANMDQWIGRADYIINSNNTFFFRYGQNPFNEFRGLTFVSDPSQVNPAEPTGNSPLIRNGRNWTFNWTSTISSRMTFDLRFGLNRWEETTGNRFGANFNPTQLGFDPALVAQFTKLQFPLLNLGTYQNMGTDRLLNYATNDTYSVQPNFGLVVGTHFLKFGAEGRRYNDNSQNPGLASGAYTFGKNWTQAVASRGDAVSGNELATFLLGYPTSAYVDRNIDPAFTHNYYALFFQDDWKVTSRLTLNLGLRWDYEAPTVERYNRMVRGLDFTAPSPIASQVQGLNLQGAVLFAGLGQPRGAFQPDRNNFAPRIGAAYRLGDKWVLRGGYGLYYLGQSATGSNQGFSQRTTAVVSVDNNFTPAVNLANAFALQPGGQLLDAVGNSEGAASFLGQGMTVNYLNRPLPYSHQYSFDIQRELPFNMLVEVGYVGNQTFKLPVTAGLNYVPLDQLNRRTPAGAIDLAYYSEKVPNPMAGLLPNNASLNGATIPRVNLMYAYPQFAGLNVANLPIGKQRYDSFQIKGTKRMSQGLTFLTSYTVAKTFEQVSLLNAQYLNFTSPSSTPLDKRLANQIDTPQKFSFVAVYDLPFGIGRSMAASVPKALDYVIGGWQLNFDITYMKGWAIDYPNANQVSPGSAKLDSSQQTFENWFNTSLWNDPATGQRVAPQEPYTLRTFPTRFSDVRVPGYHNWDASLSKYFPIYERMRLQFRFEMINAFNHPWFSDIQSVDVTNSGFGQLRAQQRNLPRFLKLGLNLQW